MSENDKASPDDAITIEEVTALLGPPRRTIYQKIQEDDDFPRPFKVGKRLLWIRKEVLAYREKKQAEFAEKHKPPSAEAKERWERQAAAGREYARRMRHIQSLKQRERGSK